MTMVNRHQWARPIFFEGVELPATAIAIDHLGKEPEMSEEASRWLWQFTNCVGVTKYSRSEDVVRLATEALRVATEFRELLLREMPSRFDGPFDKQVLDEWISSLNTMIKIAGNRPSCSWTAPGL